MNQTRFSRSNELPFLLMTRFALHPDAEIIDWLGTGGGRPVRRYLDDVWLSKRFDWFEQICAPSVRGQEDQGFEWLIGLSSEVPTFWVNRLSRVAGGGARILLVEPEASFSEVRRELGHGDEFISARLDSDDAVSSDFIAKVKDRITPGEALCLVHGIQLNESPRGLFHRFSRSNSFSAFWTLGNRDVFELGRHKDIGATVPLRHTLTLRPHYLVYVHDSNTSRYSKRGPFVFRPGRALARFSLPRGFEPSFADQVRLAWSTTMGLLDSRLPSLARVVSMWRRRLAEVVNSSPIRGEG